MTRPLGETTESIADWQTETFGPQGNKLRKALRALKEMQELLTKICDEASDDDIREEAADVVITMVGLFSWADVEKKMSINRKRTWTFDGKGHGQHVTDPRDVTPRFVITTEPTCSNCGMIGFHDPECRYAEDGA